MVYEEWWKTVGSGLAPLPSEDTEEHAKRVTSLAWHAAELALPSGKTSDLQVKGLVILDSEMRKWAQARGMHLFFIGSWHVMIAKTWCTVGYETPQKALEACWESGEYDNLAKCQAAKSFS
jgi:hypothetical protein